MGRLVRTVIVAGMLVAAPLAGHFLGAGFPVRDCTGEGAAAATWQTAGSLAWFAVSLVLAATTGGLAGLVAGLLLPSRGGCLAVTAFSAVLALAAVLSLNAAIDAGRCAGGRDVAGSLLVYAAMTLMGGLVGLAGGMLIGRVRARDRGDAAADAGHGG